MLKGISGHRLLMDFPEIKEQLWKGQLWNDSYFVESIGSTSQENIQKYIDRVKVDKLFASTKTCHCCGYKKTDLTLKDRGWTCPNCNTYHNRDINAAINIKNEGLRLLSVA